MVELRHLGSATAWWGSGVAPNKGDCSPDRPYQRRAGRDNQHAVLLLVDPFSLRHADSAAAAAAAALLLGHNTVV
jgi:hypothetical protein